MKKSSLIILISFLVLASAGAIWLSFQYDRPVREAIVEAQGKKWKKSDEYKFHGAVRKYGDWAPIMAAAVIGLIVAWRMRNREWTKILAAAMIASTMAGILVNTVRLTSGRTRPRESPKIEQGFYGPWKDGQLLIGRPAYNSFPSGHTATAFGFAGVILFARPWIGIGALLLAGLVGWSSIAIGAHHPSDVTVSTIFALAVAWYVWKWMRKNGERTWIVLRWKLHRFRLRHRAKR